MSTEHRDNTGRFLKGNPGGPGNPMAARVHEYRQALLDAVTPDDIRRVARALVDAAAGGDVAAARVLFDRVLGRAELTVTADVQAAGVDAIPAREKLMAALQDLAVRSDEAEKALTRE